MGSLSRGKRASLSLEQIKAALEANPKLQQQIGLRTSESASPSPGSRMNAVSVAALQQQLMAIGGDHKVTKRLVVLNSEEDLRYYVQTGLSDYRTAYGRKK
uniref:ZP domain-containing protein n=1 Tax=Steinernema glaseri TaxID=37863 RepID=A0A1I7Z6U3_9BILA